MSTFALEEECSSHTLSVGVEGTECPVTGIYGVTCSVWWMG